MRHIRGPRSGMKRSGDSDFNGWTYDRLTVGVAGGGRACRLVLPLLAQKGVFDE